MLNGFDDGVTVKTGNILITFVAVTKRKTGTWDLGLEDSGTRGRGDVGTRGRGDSERWDASTSELGDAWGFEDVINK